jgi:carbonic anhydrase/acetyltransferase-like protein (isoleucine patch superfamily)
MTIRSFEGIDPKVPASAYVDETALIIGDVSLGEDASLWPMAVARGDMHAITIGDRSNIQDHTMLHVTHDGPYSPGGQALHIANDVTVGHHVVLHGCTVEALCLIGIGCVVMDGAVIRARNLVGAGSLVPPGKELESGFLWVGRPVKAVRALTDREMEFLGYSAQHYVRTKDRHLRANGARGD